MLQPPRRVHNTAGHRFRGSEDRGATAAEYALMTSFIAVAIFGAVLTVGSRISQVLTSAAGAL